MHKLITLGILLTSFQTLKAATVTWKSTVANGSFSTATNWVGNVAPTSSDDVVFTNSTATVDIDGNFTVKSLKIDGCNVSFTTSDDRIFTVNGGLFSMANFAILNVNSPKAIVLTLQSGASEENGCILSFAGVGSTGGSNLNCVGGSNVFNGTIECQENSGNITGVAGLVFGETANYILEKDGGVIPAAAWNPLSTIQVKGMKTTFPTINGAAPFNLPNIYVNTNVDGNDINFNISPNTVIKGDVSINNIGNSRFLFATDLTNLTIEKSLNINACNVQLSNNATGNLACTIGGDIRIDNGTLDISGGTNGNMLLNLKGNLSILSFVPRRGDPSRRLSVSCGLALTVSGNGSNSGVNFVGTNPQFVTNVGGDFTGANLKLTVNKSSSDVTLTSDIYLPSNLTLTNGKINCNGSNLSVSSISSVNPTTNYVVTDGTGSLTIRNVPTTGINFPVGSSVSSYDPVAITPSVISDFTVTAVPSITHPVANASDACDREWNIAARTPSNTTLEFKPNPSAACTASSTSVIGQLMTDGIWKETTVMPSGGPFMSYPYSALTSTFTTFAVGKPNSFKLTVLAVELKSFIAYGKGDANVVEWTTANEKNAKEFIVERSLNGADNWTSVGKKAASNNDIALNYNLKDNNTAALTYYRLLSVDVSGKTQVSKVVSVSRTIGGKLNISKMYPTPTTDKVAVDFQTAAEGTIQILVSDILGRVIKSDKMDVETGLNHLDLDVTNLSSGSYFLTIQDKTSVASKRIIKQ